MLLKYNTISDAVECISAEKERTESQMQPKYKRILLKLSGEAMAGEAHSGLDFDTVLNICQYIKEAAALGTEIAIVVGGGNFWRGRSSGKMDRTRADHMGMLATTINALGLADALEQLGCEVRVQTAIAMHEIAEPYIRNRAVRHLEKGASWSLAAAPAILSSPPTRLPLCVRLRSRRRSFSRPVWWTVSTTAIPTRTPTL